MIRLDAPAIDETRATTKNGNERWKLSGATRRPRSVGVDAASARIRSMMGRHRDRASALLIRSRMAFHRKGGVWTQMTSHDSWICVDV